MDDVEKSEKILSGECLECGIVKGHQLTCSQNRSIDAKMQQLRRHIVGEYEKLHEEINKADYQKLKDINTIVNEMVARSKGYQTK